MIDENVVEEMLDELFSILETLETQNRAILEFMKDRGIAKEEELAPFFEEAAKASNVRWRATRIRVNHLLAGRSKANEIPRQEPTPSTEKNQDQQAAQDRRDAEEREKTRERTEPEPKNGKGADKDQDAPQQTSDGNQKAESGDVDKSANKHRAKGDIS